MATGRIDQFQSFTNAPAYPQRAPLSLLGFPGLPAPPIACLFMAGTSPCSQAHLRSNRFPLGRPDAVLTMVPTRSLHRFSAPTPFVCLARFTPRHRPGQIVHFTLPRRVGSFCGCAPGDSLGSLWSQGRGQLTGISGILPCRVG